ncbi:MAG: beta/gamma crystallin-related protein [Burkholderiales bacterium]|nr:beta/gamma crystallin-related protein [Burkholderiales bacterium]
MQAIRTPQLSVTPRRLCIALGALLFTGFAHANVIFYEHDNFEGRSFRSDNRVNNFQRSGFNDRASSVIVLNERWEICDDEQMRGNCVVLRPGRYSSLSRMNLNDRVSSARPLPRGARYDDSRYAPPAEPVYDNRRRQNERLYDAPVTSVRAVLGEASQRCWIEREEYTRNRNDERNVPGAVLGALLGGVLGHQVGGGRGKDLATAGGAVAGAVIGSNAGRSDNDYSTRDVRRCETVGNARPNYWDVTYAWRGVEHRVQTTFEPGGTLRVNQNGEPRA